MSAVPSDRPYLTRRAQLRSTTSVGRHLGREDEDLVGGNPVGVAHHITVALEDLWPAAGISQFALGDARQGVAAADDIEARWGCVGVSSGRVRTWPGEIRSGWRMLRLSRKISGQRLASPSCCWAMPDRVSPDWTV
jgi:hypothetical protein